MDDRLQWLMTELDLEIMSRRMEHRGMKKAKQDPSIFLKSSVSEIETAAAVAAENQKQDRNNSRKGVTEMEKQEEKDDLHHIDKKQKMDSEMEKQEDQKQDSINSRKSVSEMENQDLRTEMEKQDDLQMNQQDMSFTYSPMHLYCSTISPHLILGNPSIPWPPPEEETPWAIGHRWFP